ncbi:MAG TPA: hypothetical protein VL133_12790, partial [Devosia sp.]|nr:hypothetical protein [Devosia sp.]
VWWANWRATGGEGELLNGAPARARASVSYQDAAGVRQVLRMTATADGSDVAVAADGENLKFVVPVRLLRGTAVSIRFWGSFPNGMNYSHWQADYPNGDVLAYGASRPDLTGSEDDFKNSYTGANDGFAPVAIMAETRRITIGICGESRDSGLGDRPMDRLGHIGQFARLIGDRLAYQNVSVPGEQAASFKDPNASARRRELLSYATHLALGMGANDTVAMNFPPAQVLADLETIAREIGKPTVVKTLDPWTDANGGGYGLENVRPNDANRRELNAMLRDTPEVFEGLYDPALLLEGKDGLWISPFAAQPDGVHETNLANAYAALKSNFDFGLWGNPEKLTNLTLSP